jgi:hypothetical protein
MNVTALCDPGRSIVGRAISGIYRPLSIDLVHWGQCRRRMPATIPWTYRCGHSPSEECPSIIGPNSRVASFATIGACADCFLSRIDFAESSFSENQDFACDPVTLQLPATTRATAR